MPSETRAHIEESIALMVSPATAAFDHIDILSARKSLHENRLSEIKDQIIANSPSSDHQTAMKIVIDNVKRMCDFIKNISNSVLFKQYSSKYSDNLFKECQTKDVLDISEHVSKNSIEHCQDAIKYDFGSNQSYHICSDHSDFIQSFSSKWMLWMLNYLINPPIWIPLI